jgi:exopolysaccharide biosynthesis protein
VYQELAEIMLALGVEVAINLDGGGSSTFATQREGE